MIWALLSCIPEPGKSVHDPDHDFDGDGYSEQQGDCDDADSAVTLAPGWYLDADGDGHGGAEAGAACEAPAGAVSTSDDCDDTRADTYPGAADPCDTLDQGCDGPAPEELDGDGDGWLACEDCDDSDDAVHPGQPDPCDGLDAACDGAVCEPELLLREEHAEFALPGDPGQGGVVKVSGDLVGVGASTRQVPFLDTPAVQMIVAPSFEVLSFGFSDVGEHSTLSPVGDVTEDGVTDWLAASYCYSPGCAGETESYAVLLDGAQFEGAQLEGGTLGAEGRLVGPTGSCVGHTSAPLDGGFALTGACADGDAGLVWLVPAPLDPGEDLDLSEVPRMTGDNVTLYAPGFALASGDLVGDGALELALGSYGYTGLQVVLVEDAMQAPVSSLLDAPLLTSERSTRDQTGKGTPVLFLPRPDGTEQLVIGAPGDPEDGGRVYVGASPTDDEFGDSPIELAGPTSFGAALADLGDVDGDGVHDLAVGEPDGDDLEPYASTSGGYVRIVSGAALVAGSFEIDELALLVVEGEPGAHLGASVAGGDFDGDGRGDLVVGQEDPVVGPAVLLFTDLLSE
jgi:hypothetical protein